MGNDDNQSNTKDIIDATTNLVKAVPIYEDAVQSGAKEIGKAIGTLGKAVNVALSPLALVVWGYEQVKDFLETSVTDKLSSIPENQISSPPTNVAGPAVEALKFAGQDETLREMFANLIANSMDANTVSEAHPAFVDIIKSLTADEGLILKFFAQNKSQPIVDLQLKENEQKGYRFLKKNHSNIGLDADCTNTNITSNHLDNLCHLGLLHIPPEVSFEDKSLYQVIEDSKYVKEARKIAEGTQSGTINLDYKVIETTAFGQQFIKACVIDKKAK